jgi:hypothetical protein
MPVGGFIVNRVYGEVLGDPDAKAAWEAIREDPARMLPGLEPPAGSELAVRVAENFERFEVLGRRDRVQIDRLERACPIARLRRTIPAFDVDVHDLSGLARINRHLFPADRSSDETPRA